MHREGARNPLDYACTGPACELKANAADMLKFGEAKELLHVPENDDLSEISFELRLAFLRYQLMMRLLNLIK